MGIMLSRKISSYRHQQTLSNQNYLLLGQMGQESNYFPMGSLKISSEKHNQEASNFLKKKSMNNKLMFNLL